MNTLSPPPVPPILGEALLKFPQIWGVRGQVSIRAGSLVFSRGIFRDFRLHLNLLAMFSTILGIVENIVRAGISAH
jgi:hypothetical protein